MVCVVANDTLSTIVAVSLSFVSKIFEAVPLRPSLCNIVYKSYVPIFTCTLTLQNGNAVMLTVLLGGRN